MTTDPNVIQLRQPTVSFTTEWKRPKTLEDWPWDQELGKPYGDINGGAMETIRIGDAPKFANPPEQEVNDLARYKDKPSPSAVILAEAIGLLEGDRAKQHGDKLSLHKTMAALFSAYLGAPVKPSEAAMLEVLMKAARTKHGLLNADDFRDGSAYFGISWECAEAGF
jgi:hypothetical protein